jgi:phage-related cro/CI family transcription regulator
METGTKEVIMMALGNKETFAKNLQRYMFEHNKDRQQVCLDLGIKYSTFAEWINGKKYPRIDKIELLANYFGIQKSDLIEEKRTFNSVEVPQYPFIPDAVAAGMPCTIEGIKELPTIGISDAIMGKYAGNKHIIIMRVNGESMNKVIPSGSFVAVKTDVNADSLKDGDLVVFGKEHEYSLKHFYNAGDKIIFKPNSTDVKFTDHVYNKDEPVTIVGKVVMSVRNYI